MTFKYIVTVAALLCTATQAADSSYRFKKEAPSKPRIAIIIDDIGNNLPLGERTIALKGNLTLAVLPKTPGAKILANKGHASGKEIMLHAPMSNYHNKDLGPGGLTSTMDQETFLRTLNESILSVPHIKGVNNHMGSELTTVKESMQWLMEELKSKNLYFIDSLTNSRSIALKSARNHGVSAQQRDIFLDHLQDEAEIEKAFRKLIRVAKINGYAIGIGHPYPETLNVLERVLPQLNAEDIDLVHVSKLLDID